MIASENSHCTLNSYEPHLQNCAHESNFIEINDKLLPYNIVTDLWKVIRQKMREDTFRGGWQDNGYAPLNIVYFDKQKWHTENITGVLIHWEMCCLASLVTLYIYSCLLSYRITSGYFIYNITLDWVGSVGLILIITSTASNFPNYKLANKLE